MWRHSTLIIPSLIARRQSLFQSRSFLILQSNQLTELAFDRIDVSGETIRLSISLRLAVDFLQILTYVKINKCWHLILYFTCGQVGVP